MDNFLSKENQAKLKAQYAEALMAYWKENKITDSMTKCCLGHVAVFVPILGGKFIAIVEKERIDKTFYFGYSDCGQGRSWDENQDLAAHVRKNIEEYFIKHNLEGVDRWIREFEDYLEYENIEGDVPKMYCYPHYYGQDPDAVLCHVTTCRPGWDVIPENAKEVPFEDVRLIIEAYKEYRVMLEKQLNTYLKKYGAKHLHVSTYWVDR